MTSRDRFSAIETALTSKTGTLHTGDATPTSTTSTSESAQGPHTPRDLEPPGPEVIDGQQSSHGVDLILALERRLSRDEVKGYAPHAPQVRLGGARWDRVILCCVVRRYMAFLCRVVR